MGKKTSSLWTLGEPLSLGLSCLVGGEQFYLLLYGTGRSVRAQSFVLVFTAIITCVLSAAVSNRTDILAHFFHLFYIFMLILQMTIANEITGRVTATLITIGLGYALAMLVIQSCSLYSNSREELLTFILGMFSARYLPCFLRLFVSKGCSCDSKIRKLSKALGTSRLVLCIISLALKILMGRFHLTYKEPIKIEHKIETDGTQCSQSVNSQQGEQSNGIVSRIVKSFNINWENISSNLGNFHKKSLEEGFNEIWDHRKYIYSKSGFDYHLEEIIQYYHEDSDEGHDFYKVVEYILAKLILFSKQFSKPLPIVLFLSSVFMFLMYPKTSFSAYCSYSPKVISIMMNVKYLLYIIGSLVGIGYPASVTSNSPLFATITFFFYFLVTLYFFLPHWDRYFTQPSLYVIVGASSFILGYMSSYSLGLIINMVLKETCVYEEVETFEIKEEQYHNLKIGMKKTCCGDQITSRCHCKLEEIFDFLDIKYEGRTFVCSTLFVRDDGKLSDRYSPSGKCAIILMYNCDGSDCEKNCDTTCQSNPKGKCCLKIIGKYKVDAVTVSSCEDCQLTIRLEGTCWDSKQCTSSGDSSNTCVCNGNNKCCICVKCCNATCGTQKCCCIHYCKTEQCTCDCKNKKYEVKDARLFICYKTNGNKCCIKEIRPNDKADFAGDLKRKDLFDIDDIFISDCCHVDMRVDLRCTVKNNYFRLGGANYPNKFEKPDIVSLLWSESVCCPKAQTQCCCMFSQLVRGYIIFLQPTVKHKITICGNIKCTCNGDSGLCCIRPCDLIVDDSGGFVTRVDRIRVKIVVISWLLFGLVFFFVVLFTSILRSKYSPVTFYPMTSYSKLAGTFARNKYNSNDQVTRRILSLLVNGKMSDQTIEAKKIEMKAMLRMFAKYTTIQETKKTKKRKPKEVEKIHKYITSKAANFTPSSSVGRRECDLCVVEWSLCVGLVYKYVMPLFFFTQKFFIAWEKAWKIDFYNYKKQMVPYVAKVTHSSNISLSTVMSGVKVGDKSNQMGLNRLMTWNSGFKETKQLSRGKMEEVNMINESIPPKIGNRLCYYVRRWNHRLDNIRNWLEYESHVFDWDKFVYEYYKIREWVTDVSPGLRCDSEVKVSTKDLNKGIKIFIETM